VSSAARASAESIFTAPWIAAIGHFERIEFDAARPLSGTVTDFDWMTRPFSTSEALRTALAGTETAMVPARDVFAPL